ncbi:MAG: WG repeat-containing protein [Chitinophagaceae bacterium]|nr:WG repeat-containing protein [Chitinophagaceae bacterium]
MIKKITILKCYFVFILFLFFAITSLNAQVKGVEGKNGKWGLVNGSGKMITPYLYNGVSGDGRFSDELLSVSLNGKWGSIDTTGKVVIPIKYNDCGPFKYGVGTIWLGEKCGLIDKTGKIIIAPNKFDMLTILDANYIQTRLHQSQTNGIVTTKGYEILPCIYLELMGVAQKNELRWLVRKDKKRGFYNDAFEIVIPCIYDDESNSRFSEGTAPVALNKKWGFIDMTGKVVIPLVNEMANILNGKFYIRLNGELIEIPNPTKK